MVEIVRVLPVLIATVLACMCFSHSAPTELIRGEFSCKIL